MKKIILSAIAVMSMTAAVNAGEVAVSSTAADSVESALKNGKFNMDARLYYFNRTSDGSTPSSEALAFGGTISYESASFNGLKIGTSLSTSNLLTGLIDRKRSAGTGLVDKDLENYSLLSRAYLQYDIENTMFKVGRQNLNTPFFNGNDSRMIAQFYEAGIVRNKDIPNTVVEGGYITGTSGNKSSNVEFSNNEASYGDEGVGYIYLTNNSIENLNIKAFYAKKVSDTYKNAGVKTDVDSTDYQYFEAKYKLPFGENTKVMVQYTGNTYQHEDDFMMFGAGVSAEEGIFNMFVGFEKIINNDIDYENFTEMYTDFQQGYNNYGPSTGFSLILGAKPMDNLNVAVKGAWVRSDDYADNVNNGVENVADDFDEYNLDVTYKINSYSKIRARYSLRDQSSKSKVDDRTDGRVIYYVNF